ncbi:MAG TPA: hemerythrin domain-containing protein [Methylomirabilota bacterium]
MKRHPSLQPLSDDHHRALVLARRLRRTSTGADATVLGALAREVQREFDEAIEPHFRVEERWLLPVLERRGEGRLAAQTLEDHARLRALVHGVWSEATAQTLGGLLQRHVRFEERVLFPEAEVVLSEAELASVRDAADSRKGEGETWSF